MQLHLNKIKHRQQVSILFFIGISHLFINLSNIVLCTADNVSIFYISATVDMVELILILGVLLRILNIRKLRSRHIAAVV